MRKILLPLLLCLLLAGCGDTMMVGFTTVTTEEEETCGPGVPAEEPVEELTEIPGLPNGWLFASGAGGWGTELYLQEKGVFTGEYRDSEMGISDPEKFPNGTVYTNRFNGWSGLPEQQENGTWILPILSLETQDVPETEWYGDGIRYIAAEPFGIAGAEELTVYPAGFPLADLPENFYTGWADYDLRQAEEVLPFWVLYNETEQWGFVEYECVQVVEDESME